jgi:hypothetical protein
MDLINSNTSKVVIKEIVLRTIEKHINRLKDVDLQKTYKFKDDNFEYTIKHDLTGDFYHFDLFGRINDKYLYFINGNYVVFKNGLLEYLHDPQFCYSKKFMGLSNTSFSLLK